MALSAMQSQTPLSSVLKASRRPSVSARSRTSPLSGRAIYDAPQFEASVLFGPVENSEQVLGTLISAATNCQPPLDIAAARRPSATKSLQMQEDPIDRHFDPWMERKRRIDHEDAKRRDEMERYQDGSSRRMHSPPMGGRSEARLGPPNGPDGSRNGFSPRTRLPSFNNLTKGSEEQLAREEAEAAYKRRRIAEDSVEHRNRDGSLTPPEHGNRSPQHHARPDLRPPPHRYADERDPRFEDRSPRDAAHFGQRPNGRASPMGDRHRPMHSPGAPGIPLPPVQDFRKPSVLSGGPEESFDGSPSMPGLARRRGDAAQAKASRLHIDTGNAAPGPFEMHAMGSRSAGVAKSAPPQKLTFEREGMEPPLPYDRRDGGRHLHPQAAGGFAPLTAVHAPRDHRAVSGSRLHELSEASSRKDPRDDVAGSRDGPRLPELPQTANPLARQGLAPGRGLGGPGAGYVPQTATLPSPAYHTTQFARGATGAPRLPGPQPPQTARLPEHLRSPPSSKAHFLGLFSDFYESLHDSRTLKATLEDQIRRSNTLLQTLQSSRRVLEETVERRVREERVLWEGRVRGLEARVRELEAKNGDANPEGSTSSGRGSPLSASKTRADGSRSSSANREGADKLPPPTFGKPGLGRTASKASLHVSRDAEDDHDMGSAGEHDELRSPRAA